MKLLKLVMVLWLPVFFQHTLAADIATQKFFNVESLKARGIAPDVVTFFKEGKRFSTGINYVTLIVNGSKIGSVQARFDEQGQLCSDVAFLARAHIVVPISEQNIACIKLESIYPQAIIKLFPGKEQIELIVPQHALSSSIESKSAKHYQAGGTAGIINYDLLYMQSNSDHTNNTILQLGTELGLNMDKWSIRSTQSYVTGSNQSQFTHLNAYAQTSLPDYKSVLQIGQINVAGGMFDSPTLLGAQLFPEYALLQQAGNRVVAEGIAETEARVEVRQNSALIYSTIVPPGLFALTGISLNNITADLQVTVFEIDGRQRSFVIPASSFAVTYIPKETSFSFTVGKPWRYSNEENSSGSDWVSSARVDFPLGSSASFAVGALVSDIYYSLGAQYNAALNRSLTVNTSTLISYDPAMNDMGAQSTFGVVGKLVDALFGSASYSHYSSLFRTFSDASMVTQNKSGRQQFNVNLTYNHIAFGGIGVSYFQSMYNKHDEFRQNDESRRLNVNWNKSFQYANLSLNADKTLGDSGDTRFYAALNIPFGTGRLNSFVHGTRKKQTISTSYSDRINDTDSYALSVDTDTNDYQAGARAVANIFTRYARSNFSVAHSGSGNRSYSGQMSGGMAIHDSGVTISPYPVRETFALMNVMGIPSARVMTPSGPVWTDRNGMAVAADVPAYGSARLELQTKTLPKNVDVKNGLQTTELARSAVGKITFEVIRTRRFLLKVVDEQGRGLNKGSPVFNEAGGWISSVANGSTVFLREEQVRQALAFSNASGSLCYVQIELPAQPVADVFYENIDAVCKASL